MWHSPFHLLEYKRWGILNILTGNRYFACYQQPRQHGLYVEVYNLSTTTLSHSRTVVSHGTKKFTYMIIHNVVPRHGALTLSISCFSSFDGLISSITRINHWYSNTHPGDQACLQRPFSDLGLSVSKVGCAAQYVCTSYLVTSHGAYCWARVEAIRFLSCVRDKPREFVGFDNNIESKYSPCSKSSQ